MVGYIGFEDIDKAIGQASGSFYGTSIVQKDDEENYYVVDDKMHGEVWIPIFEEASTCNKYWHVGDGVELPLNNDGSLSSDYLIRYCGENYNKFTFRKWIDPIQECMKMGMARLETTGEFSEIPLNAVVLNAYNVRHEIAKGETVECQLTALPMELRFFASEEECCDNNEGMAEESFIPFGTYGSKTEEVDLKWDEEDEDEVVYEEWDDEDDLEELADKTYIEWDDEEDLEAELDRMEADLDSFEREVYKEDEERDDNDLPYESPQALISGRVKLVEKHTNKFTGKPYLHVVMESLGVTYDLVVTAENFDMPLDEIKYVSGTFILVAHMKCDQEERIGKNYKFEIDGTCSEKEFDERFAPYITEMRSMKYEHFILEFGEDRDDRIEFMQTTKYNDVGEPDQYRVEYATGYGEGKRKLYALDSDEVSCEMAYEAMKAIATGNTIPGKWRDVTYEIFGKEYIESE